MRYGEGHKEATRKRILDRSSELLRKAGLGGLGVAKAMKAAGLTVGGFYNHFGTQQRFVAETLRHTFAASRERLLASELRGQEFLEYFVRSYLSRTHRDGEGAKCPLPATLSEVPRAGDPSRQVFAEELEALLSGLGDRLPGGRPQALAVFALCVGGLTLARALGDVPLSEEVLRACRRHLISART